MPNLMTKRPARGGRSYGMIWLENIEFCWLGAFKVSEFCFSSNMYMLYVDGDERLAVASLLDPEGRK